MEGWIKEINNEYKKVSDLRKELESYIYDKNQLKNQIKDQ